MPESARVLILADDDCESALLGRHVPIKRNREHVHIKWFTRADWEKLENKLAFNQWLVFKQYFGL